MSKRIRKWYVSEEESLGSLEIIINEEGPEDAMWPAEGKEGWMLAQLNPNLETLAEKNPSVAKIGWYARMMAAAPMMRHLLEKVDKDGWSLKWGNRMHELLRNIDDGYNQSEMKESWDEYE